MKKFKNLFKKAQLGNLQGIVITLVVVGIILGVGFYILAEFQDIIRDEVTGENASQAYLGVNKTIAAMAKIPQWLSIIVIVAIVGIVMAILFAVFPTGARV